MTNLCDVCGKPATQSMLRDLFGKSDEMRFVCSDHGFRIRDPADVAEIERLRAENVLQWQNVQELLAENAKLQGASHEPKVGETFPAFMYCPTCSQLYTGRGGQDGYPMMLTCPNHHSWQDPRPVEGASRDASSDWRIGPNTREPGCKCVVSGSFVDGTKCPIHGFPTASRTFE